MNSTDRQPSTRTGRLVRATQTFVTGEEIFVHCPVRDVLEVLYPEYASRIYTVQSVRGLRYVLRIEREVPDFDSELGEHQEELI